jgi:cysteine sulfinate desulfinase/cysteine desulfurase-like protein
VVTQSYHRGRAFYNHTPKRGKEVFMTKTKNSELIKLINCIEEAGYQVDSIKILPEGVVNLEPGRCLINIKASPLVEVQVSESLEQTKEN